MGIQNRNVADDSQLKREIYTLNFKDDILVAGQWEFAIDMAGIADGDTIKQFTPGFAGTITAFDFYVVDPVTTGSKASTLNLEIGTTNVEKTGDAAATLALTSAACDAVGDVVNGETIVAENTFAADDTITVEAASTTAFIEGQGVLVIKYIGRHINLSAQNNLSLGKPEKDSTDTENIFVIEDVQLFAQTVGDDTTHLLAADVKNNGSSVCSTTPKIAAGATAPSCSADGGTGETDAVLDDDYVEVAAGTELLCNLSFVNSAATGDWSKGFGHVRVEVHGYWKDEF